MNTINTSLNTNSQSDAAYLDFRKAFDSVAHKELLFKLWTFGITGGVWKWIQAYLTNRFQYVAINGAASGVLPVISNLKSHYEVVLSKAYKILVLLRRVFSSSLCVKAKKFFIFPLFGPSYCTEQNLF